MLGRYGVDALGKCLMVVYITFAVISTVLTLTLFKDNVVAYIIMGAICATIFVLTYWRMMSRNIAKRRRENQLFCNFFKLRRDKFRDRKTHVYRKCPSCKATLRLPRAKGMHTVVCPRCKHRFSVKGT